MKEFESINDILDFAINNEQNAVDFYTELAANATTEDMREVFENFAKEEVSHKARLTHIKDNGVFEGGYEAVQDLKIADYLVRTEPKESMTYADALVLAMKREKAAFKLYLHLSERAPNSDLKKLFMSLANEESKHKLRFEIEYDEYVLREN